MGREHFKDGKAPMSGPSKVYFHVLNNNPFTFSFECVQHHIMTLQMDTVKLHLDAFKSMSDVNKIPFQRLGLPMPFLILFLSWSYICLIYLINILALTHIEPLFHFWTPENFWKLYDFLKFSGDKNRTLVRYGSRKYLLLSHCKIMCYFLPPKNFRKLSSFIVSWLFLWVKNGTLAYYRINWSLS